MIRLASEKDLDTVMELCGAHPVQGARICTLLAVYGWNAGVSLWLSGDGGVWSAVLLFFDGRFTLAGHGWNETELAEFLMVVGGFTHIEGPPAVCANLQKHLSCSKREFLVLKQTAPMEKLSWGIVDNPSPRHIYEILAGCGYRPDWENWYPHTSHLLRHNLGFAAAIYRNCKPVCCGGVYATSPNHAVIGGVATLPTHRGNGYAGAVVKHLSAMCQLQKRTPLLCCEHHLFAHYQRLGFAPAGTLCELALNGPT